MAQRTGYPRGIGIDASSIGAISTATSQNKTRQL
jgi:hypothetical protein